MVFAYVTLHPSLDRTDSSSRIYALLLPREGSDEWEEVDVRPSNISGAGFGVFPHTVKKAGALTWAALRTPVLLPYLGAETVVKDDHSRKMLLAVLRGEFVRLTVGELMDATGDRPYVADGLFAVPHDAAAPRASGRPRTALSRDTQLLQVAYPDATNRFVRGVQTLHGGHSSVCYLLEGDARTALHLTGERAHLFELLCAHASYDHVDRHLATHVASLHRPEEGYVLVNGHPGFLDPVALTAIINEPAPRASACVKMVQGYARLLDDSDPRMRATGLRQPSGALSAWRATILPPHGIDAPDGLSERMVLYATTRKTYGERQELTVDYGRAYVRNYASGTHKPRPEPMPSPADAFTTAQLGAPRFPQLPGWFNPRRQPARRPAFRRDSSGSVAVVPDDPKLVRARCAALGLTDAPATPSSGSSPRNAIKADNEPTAATARAAGKGALRVQVLARKARDNIPVSTPSAASDRAVTGKRERTPVADGGTPKASRNAKRPRLIPGEAAGGLMGMFVSRRTSFVDESRDSTPRRKGATQAADKTANGLTAPRRSAVNGSL